MSPSETPLTWLVTGASSGLGLAICHAALGGGHKVAGGTRDIAKARTANPDFEARGDSATAFADADRKLGGIDVLVNNAGYGYIAGVEDMSEEKLREQMEVNFYGPMRGVRTLLPGMRTRGSGDIVLISSGAGFFGIAGRGAYCSSKWAIEAMHESLSREVKGLGVNVLIVEPGAFLTPFFGRAITSGPVSEGYKGSPLDTAYSVVESLSDTDRLKEYMRGDPDKAARAVVGAVVGGHDGYLRLVLGPDCWKALEVKLGERRRDMEATREISLSTDRDTETTLLGPLRALGQG
ncbi:hypothetical protein F5Y16DRAFT_364781 [Xylariaceae sp. FL0255]|nr:hypothetical protein F5Y16DRAFT_364781 [Xylariaceae sp. FL0255]